MRPTVTPFHQTVQYRDISLLYSLLPLPSLSLYRNTLAELYPSASHKQLPAFPVNILPNSGSLVRDTSPTKSLYSSSPTNSLTMTTVGRRSPNLDSQMDAIAEDCTEDLTTPTVTPTETIPPTTLVSAPPTGPGRTSEPAYMRHGRTSLGANEPGFQRPGRTSVGGNETGFQRPGRTSVGGNETSFQRPGRTSVGSNETGFQRTSFGGNEALVYPIPVSSDEPPTYQQRPVTPGDDKRQRRTGASMLQTSFPSNAPAKNGLHQLLMSPNNQTKTTAPSNNHHVLLGMLQSPLSNTQQQDTNPVINRYSTQQPSQDLLGMAALVQIQQLANHVSTVLNNFGLPHVHQNNVFTVDHHGVRFQIHVAGNIQLRYVAGDMTQYQSLCSQLYSSLIPTTQ